MQCVLIDPVKLASYGCTVAEVRAALNQQITFRKVNWKQYRAYRKTVGNLQQPKNLITLS
jgi:HAE1 family hydrophobic/amphiphilic exporter-1/multidrug efflux pump